RPPGGIGVGGPGGLPAVVVLVKPALLRVTVCPWLVFVTYSPKMKWVVVCLLVTVKMLIPPRTPIVLAGGLTVIGVFLLIFPPTRRNTPVVAVRASSPVLVFGSNTYLSIVTRE